MLFAMLFGQYPFDSPADAALRDNERGQRMMRRILQACVCAFPQ